MVVLEVPRYSFAAIVNAWAEQTVMLQRLQVQIVVVYDGSTDGMLGIARRLRAERLIDEILRVETRGGKSAGVWLRKFRGGFDGRSATFRLIDVAALPPSHVMRQVEQA
jgi:hypothetical protein